MIMEGNRDDDTSRGTSLIYVVLFHVRVLFVVFITEIWVLLSLKTQLHSALRPIEPPLRPLKLTGMSAMPLVI